MMLTTWLMFEDWLMVYIRLMAKTRLLVGGYTRLMVVTWPVFETDWLLNAHVCE
jgi:hypothetical protein